ncbi:phage protein [Staphylococcus aureus]|nr:phage protein [Staphylococcus aureus]
MPVYTNGGLRFDNEQEAIDWFKTTLNTETPIGELYEKLHAVKEWEEGEFDLQATGLNDKEVHIQLDSPSHEGKVFRRVQYNSYGNNEPLEFETLKELIDNMIKSVNVASIIAFDKVIEILEAIKEGNEKYISDRVTSSENLVLTVQAERNMYDGAVVIAITDENTKEQYQDSIPSDEEGRIDIELVEKAVESIFMKQMSGKFNGEEVTVDGYKLQFLLNYAHENEKEVEVKII